MKILRTAPKFQPNHYVSIDTEWLGMNKNQLHRPTSGTFGCLTICGNPDEVHYIDDPKKIQSALYMIQDCIWVMMNATFDITQLRRYAEIKPRTKLVDIMLMERILYGGLYEFFSLKHLTRRHLDIYLEKDARDLFENATEMTPEMIEYACNDASIQLQVWNEQKKHIDKSSWKIWKEIDLPAMWAFLDFQGFRVDVNKWKELAKTNHQRQLDIDATLDFNPRSPQQVIPILRKKGFRGLKNAQAPTLQTQIHKHPDTEAAQLAKKILESKKYSKRASTYGSAMLKRYAELEVPIQEDEISTKDDGYYVFHANYHVIGAETGRTSATNPAMQTIPSRDTKEFRECFIPRPGNVLLIADYSAQEPRITGYLSQDNTLITILNSKSDIYISVAKKIFGKTITKSDPLRDTMKSTILGVDYGMKPSGLALRENITIDEAEALLRKFFNAFPGIKSWVNKQKKKKLYVTTVSGRKIWLNPYSYQCENNALNAPHQGTAADMMKLALSNIHRKWKFDYPFACVGYVHDEVIFDVPKEIAKDVAKFIKKEMETAGNHICPGIVFIADVKIANSWAEK